MTQALLAAVTDKSTLIFPTTQFEFVSPTAEMLADIPEVEVLHKNKHIYFFLSWAVVC